MSDQFSQVKWGRVILTAGVVYLLSFLTNFIVVTIYAFVLAFQARGTPDQAMIQAFANQYAPWIGPLSLLLFTFLGARHIVKRVELAFPLHGILLGTIAGLINIAFGFSLSDLLLMALTITVGWLGARK